MPWLSEVRNGHDHFSERMTRPHNLSDLLLDRSQRDPSSLALVDADTRLTYGEVATMVGRLSTQIRHEGVRPGDRVAVFAPKSTNTFVAMHAALHAGAIAVPINAMTPADAVERLARDLNPRAVVLTADTAERWPLDVSSLTIGSPVDGHRLLDWTCLESGDVDGPANRLGSDPAYLISTSGSTGVPKSIVHTHSSGLRYAELAAECYDLGPDDRMASVAPFHFDQSTFELYSSMVAGAAVVLISEILLRFPASVSGLLEREAVTTWYSVPTILRQLLERGAIEERDLSALRWVLFGGEVFPPAQLRRLMEMLPSARFSNVYGPAEVNQCMFHHLETPPDDEANIPIGRPWADTDLRIVDREGSALSGACRGELHVRSSTTMAGYWNRPDVNRSVFDERQEVGGLTSRWYRTGDLVERDVDGVMYFLGRVDRQVKVRGVRIELEAVEMALGALDGITGSAAYLDPLADNTLVGVVESDATIAESDILISLANVLVNESIPSRVVVVPRLPRTTSGKVDVNRAAALVTASIDADTTTPGAPGPKASDQVSPT